MGKIKVILNPYAGRGYAGRVSSHIKASFAALDADFDLVHTSEAGEAIDLARRALDDGYDTLVAVGGDGTSHEVVNGMMAHSNGACIGTLGCIPAGSGNDFAVMNGAPTDIAAACKQIVQGRTRHIDVGLATIDGQPRYFDNALGIGFDAMVTLECSKHTRARGMALYLPAVLKTIFVDMNPPHMDIEFDGRTISQSNLMAVVSNGPREGGGFFVAPDARTDDGLFDLVVAQAMSRIGMLALVPQFMNGSHLKNPKVEAHRTGKVAISSDEPLCVHMDGEIVAESAHHIEATILPRCLTMIAPGDTTP